MDEGSPAPLAALLRRYSYAYTANHDLGVCPQIMTEDYVLRMGEHTLSGRDGAYLLASQRQFRQFPTLGFTVHDLVLGDDRAALSLPSTDTRFVMVLGRPETASACIGGMEASPSVGSSRIIIRVARSGCRASRPRYCRQVLIRGLANHSLPTPPPKKSVGPGSNETALQTHQPAHSTTSTAPRYNAWFSTNPR